MGEWHLRYSGALRPECAEVRRGRHIVDAWSEHGAVEFQHSPIAAAEVESRAANTPGLHWILDATGTEEVHRQGETWLMDVPCASHTFRALAAAALRRRGTVWADLGGGVFFRVLEPEPHRLWDARDRRVRHMWVGDRAAGPGAVLEATGLRHMLRRPGGEDLRLESAAAPRECAGRELVPHCERSALYWDRVHREAFRSSVFPPGSTVRVVAPAGAGKTHEIIRWCHRQPDPARVLYLVFNKAMQVSAQERLHRDADLLSAVECRTQDSVMLEMWRRRHPKVPFERQLRPSGLAALFGHRAVRESAPYRWKMEVIECFEAFCASSEDEMGSGGEDPRWPMGKHKGTPISRLPDWYWKYVWDKKLMKPYFKASWEGSVKCFARRLWDLHREGAVGTCAGVAKLCSLRPEQYAEDFIGSRYSAVVIDEAQDVSAPLCRLLQRLASRDWSLVLVGDPMQRIYGWRGAVDVFAPGSFRFTHRFQLCASHRTTPGQAAWISGWDFGRHRCLGSLRRPAGAEPAGPARSPPRGAHTYLFRYWENLIEVAARSPHRADPALVAKLRELMRSADGVRDDTACGKRFRAMPDEERRGMVRAAMKNATSDATAPELKTVHSFKGCESDVVRVHADIWAARSEERDGDKVFYVAVTRHRRELFLDDPGWAAAHLAESRRKRALVRAGVCVSAALSPRRRAFSRWLRWCSSSDGSDGAAAKRPRTG